MIITITYKRIMVMAIAATITTISIFMIFVNFRVIPIHFLLIGDLHEHYPTF